MNEKRHDLIVDKVLVYNIHEGYIDWHLSSFPGLLFSSRCSFNVQNSPSIAKGDVFVWGEFNYIEIDCLFDHLKTIPDEAEDYLFACNSVDSMVGITGVLQYNESATAEMCYSGWYLKSRLFPAPLWIVNSSKEDIDMSFNGKHCEILADLLINLK